MSTNGKVLIKETHVMTGVQPKRINISVSLENYSYLKRLGKMTDSFNKVLTTVLAEHRDKKEEEYNVAQSGSDLGRDLDQTVATDTSVITQRELSHNVGI